MADSTVIPQDLTKVVEIQVKDVSTPLRLFIIRLSKKIDDLERRIEVLENP